MRVLITNDDGIGAKGINVLRRALTGLPEVELSVIAPDSNRSATARSITTRSPLWVEEIGFDDGGSGFAADGTPVDCVRFAELGLIGERPELIVSGINHGSNLGDDITYSGTVAAALEGIVLGIPAIAVSQQSGAREMDYRLGREFDFSFAAALVVELIGRLDREPLPQGTLLNVNVPAGEASGVEVTRLGKRIYRDALEQVDSDLAGRRRFRIYGDAPIYEDEVGTDLAAVAAGRVAVTPLHFDLTAEHGLESLRAYDLARLLTPAAEEITE